MTETELKESIYKKIDILPNLEIFPKFGNKPVVYFDELVSLFIKGYSTSEAAKVFNRTDSSIKKKLARLFPTVCLKGGGETWSWWILSKCDFKKCCKCKEFKSKEDFSFNSHKWDNLATECKLCNNANSSEWRKANKGAVNAYISERRLRKKQAIPPWANLDKIKEIYLNCPEGFHVDHVYPLNGINTCGLHVENNLQYLTAEDNIRKSNKLPENEPF